MNIPEEIRKPLMDFINEAGRIPNLKYVILFGSVPKGEISKKSDIDLLMLFDTDHNPEMGEEMKTAIKISSEISVKYDLVYSFSFVMKNLNDPNDVDADFLWNISKEGTIIWGRPDAELLGKPGENLEPKSLVTYSTKGLTPKQKSAIQRGLFGYKFSQKTKGKIYKEEKNGIIDKKEYKLGNGVLMVPSAIEEGIIKVLKENNADFRAIKVWK